MHVKDRDSAGAEENASFYGRSVVIAEIAIGEFYCTSNVILFV